MLLAACFGLAFFSAGCATTDPEQPWNAPQPWEGTGMVPGLSVE